MSALSLNGYLYYVIFIDDLSRKSWIYFKKAKNETFNKFQEFKAMIELQIGKHIKILRSNMVVNLSQTILKNFVRKQGSEDNSQFLIMPSRMGSRKEKQIHM